MEEEPPAGLGGGAASGVLAARLAGAPLRPALARALRPARFPPKLRDHPLQAAPELLQQLHLLRPAELLHVARHERDGEQFLFPAGSGGVREAGLEPEALSTRP